MVLKCHMILFVSDDFKPDNRLMLLFLICSGDTSPTPASPSGVFHLHCDSTGLLARLALEDIFV